MSLSPHEATLPSPTHASHTLCCHRALLTASIVCITHSLLTPSLPLAFAPTSEPPHTPRQQLLSWILSKFLQTHLLYGPEDTHHLPCVSSFLTSHDSCSRLGAVSNRQRGLLHKSSRRGANGRSHPRKAKACPRLSLMGVSNMPPPTPHILSINPTLQHQNLCLQKSRH